MIGTKFDGLLFPLWCAALPGTEEQRNSINERLEMVERQHRQMGHAYVGLRRHHAPLTLRRSLRRQLKAADKLQAEALEVTV